MEKEMEQRLLTQRFQLGRTFMTRGVAAQVAAPEIGDAIQRHQCGDWGEVTIDIWQGNDRSIEEGFRLLSTYTSEAGVKFWIITEGDRRRSTVLLPEEYGK